MANIRLIKRRIKSAKNISQITKAMELVAASKMKRAQQKAQSGKLYADKIFDMVMRLAPTVESKGHPLLVDPSPEASKRMRILISTNKGLCGGLNTNLFRMLMSEPSDDPAVWVTLGTKGAAFVHGQDGELTADFSQEFPFAGSVPALVELATREYTSGAIKAVDLIYNEFISSLEYRPTVKQIIPLRLEEEKENDPDATTTSDREFLIEPSPQDVFDRLIPHYVENQIRDAILQAEASEHSARMMAMRNATDNATSLIDDLTLLYNKARQEKITYEITDMVTARMAVS